MKKIIRKRQHQRLNLQLNRKRKKVAHHPPPKINDKDLTYKVYLTKEEGLNAFKSLIRKKYKKHFTSLPKQTFENMQPVYAPDGHVWDERCMSWYTKIYQP